MSNNTYWHVARTNDSRLPVLGNGDGRVIRVGKTLRVEGQPVLNEHGLHACAKLLDCLGYTSGTVICRVTLGGTVVHGDNKCVAQERTVIAMTTAEAGERILREFACRCALEVGHLWGMPQTVRHYLATNDNALRGALWQYRIADSRTKQGRHRWRQLTHRAAWEAALATTQTMAREAAWEAALAAARATGGQTAWEAQNEKLVSLVEAEFAKEVIR